MKRAPALAAAAIACAGLALAAFGVGAGANGQGEPGAAYRLALPALAADGATGAPFAAGTVASGRVACQVDAAGAVRATGEVANGLDRPVSRVLLRAQLLSGGEVVAEATGEALLPAISGGRAAPFDIAFEAPAPSFDDCRVDVTQYTDDGSGPMPTYGVEVYTNLATTDAQGRLHVPGQVRNTSARMANHIRVWVALTDGDGRVIAVAGDDAKPAAMTFGGKGTFEAIFDPAPVGDSFGVRTYVWGDQPIPTPTPTPTTAPAKK